METTAVDSAGTHAVGALTTAATVAFGLASPGTWAARRGPFPTEMRTVAAAAVDSVAVDAAGTAGVAAEEDVIAAAEEEGDGEGGKTGPVTGGTSRDRYTRAARESLRPLLLAFCYFEMNSNEFCWGERKTVFC